MPMPTDPAALAAAEAAARKSTIEIWTLFSVAVGVTVLRTYARLSAAGSNLRNLRADDYLVWVGVVGGLAFIYPVFDLGKKYVETF